MQNYKKGEQGWDIGGMSFGYKSYNNPNFVAPQEGKSTENVLLYIMICYNCRISFAVFQ